MGSDPLDHLKRACLFYAWMAVALVVLGLLGSLSFALGFLLTIILLPAVAVLLIIGTVLLTWRGVRIARASAEPGPKRLPVSAAAPVMFLLVLAAALPLQRSGAFAGHALKLAISQDRYERIVAEVRQAPQDHRQHVHLESAGTTYMVDHGPPLRVAFEPDGILDNWSGFVFDPTGEVMRTGRGSQPAGETASDLTVIFGGDLVGCRRLWSGFHICSFT